MPIGANGPNYTDLDFSQVLQRVFDENQDRLRVDADLSVNIPGGLEVSINAVDDSIKIGGGGPGPYLAINPDGSINVSGTTTLSGAVNLAMQPLQNYYGESTIASGATSTILTYTVPVGKTAYLQSVSVSGETIATYSLFKGLVKFAVKRTAYGPGYDAEFDFTPSGAAGLVFTAGQQILVTVTNNGPDPGLFNSNVKVIEV